MTIQQIINHRVASIVDTFMVCPTGHDTKTNAEFMKWLNNKFPNETFHARNRIRDGQDIAGEPVDFHCEPTRDSRSDRHNRYRWGSQK